MATLSSQKIVEAGIAPSYAAADTGAGDKVLNPNGNLFLHFKNSHATNSETATITAQVTTATKPGYGTVSIANIAVAVPALSEKIVGPFPVIAFNDASGFLNWSYSGTGTMTVGAFTVDTLVSP